MPKTKKLKLSTYQRKKGSVVKTEVNAPKDKSGIRGTSGKLQVCVQTFCDVPPTV
jgi:hypothetical protein